MSNFLKSAYYSLCIFFLVISSSIALGGSIRLDAANNNDVYMMPDFEVQSFSSHIECIFDTYILIAHLNRSSSGDIKKVSSGAGDAIQVTDWYGHIEEFGYKKEVHIQCLGLKRAYFKSVN